MEPRRRARWLEAGDLGSRRRAGPIGRSATFDVPSDGTRVAVAIDSRADGRSTVTITHEGLAGARAVEAQRATWKERLAQLAGLWPSSATGRRSAARADGSPSSTDD